MRFLARQFTVIPQKDQVSKYCTASQSVSQSNNRIQKDANTHAHSLTHTPYK